MSAASSLIAAPTEDRLVGAVDGPLPIVRRPLHDEATERIRDMIVEGLLVAGEWVNELDSACSCRSRGLPYAKL